VNNPIQRIERRWLADDAIQALTIPQTHTLIQAMALAIYANHRRGHTEEDTFDALLLTLPCGWGEIRELDEYAVRACKEAALIGDEALLDSRISEVAAATPEAVRPQLFAMLIALTVADRVLDPEEIHALNRFAAAFGFDDARTEALYSDTLEALDLVVEDDPT
jgi:hypothetical protein